MIVEYAKPALRPTVTQLMAVGDDCDSRATQLQAVFAVGGVTYAITRSPLWSTLAAVAAHLYLTR